MLKIAYQLGAQQAQEDFNAKYAALQDYVQKATQTAAAHPVATGALAGSALGAGAGALAAPEHRLRGALGGAAVGGALGAGAGVGYTRMQPGAEPTVSSGPAEPKTITTTHGQVLRTDEPVVIPKTGPQAVPMTEDKLDDLRGMWEANGGVPANQFTTRPIASNAAPKTLATAPASSGIPMESAKYPGNFLPQS